MCVCVYVYVCVSVRAHVCLCIYLISKITIKLHQSPLLDEKNILAYDNTLPNESLFKT